MDAPLFDLITPASGLLGGLLRGLTLLSFGSQAGFEGRRIEVGLHDLRDVERRGNRTYSGGR